VLWHQGMYSASQSGKILLDFGDEIFPIKRRCGVVTNHIVPLFVFNQTSARFINTLDPEKLLGCDATQEHDDHRIDEGNLLAKILGNTDVHFAFAGSPIPWWTALNNIGNKQCLAIEVMFSQEPIQKTPGSADKRLPALIFFPSRAFADEHNLRRYLAISWDRMGTRGVQWALRALPNAYSQFFNSLSLLGHRCASNQ